MSDQIGEKKYWYNSRTHEVEYGMQSPGPERVGPFATAAEAEHAPEVLKARALAWAEEEAVESGWDTPIHPAHPHDAD